MLKISHDKLSKALDDGYGIDVIYLDYRKAFDTVPHVTPQAAFQAVTTGNFRESLGVDKTIPVW